MANITNLVAGVNEVVTLGINPPLVDVVKIPSGFSSTDTVLKFNPDQDFIDVRAFPTLTASALLTNSIEYPATVPGGPATRIMGTFGSVFLRNVAKTDLTIDNFIVTSEETTAPTALLQATNILVDGVTTTPHQFDVVYSDNTAINAIPPWTKDGKSGSGSFDNFDVRVMGPNGFDALATFVSVNPAIDDSSSVTVTYEITAPGGTWDALDVGTYTVSVKANQVSDIKGNTVAAGDIGTFSVGQAITIPAVTTGTGNFGFSLAANGTANEFIVGAPTAGLGGQAYRYVVPSTTATTTYDSLSPTTGEFFGFAVDADGTNVLIGAPSPGNPGTAYQIPVGGVGGTTISHPQPGAAGNLDDRFGTSVTFGSSGLLIGAPFDDVGSGASTVFNVGAAYLDGTPFTNPVATGDTETVLFGGEYGYSVTDAGTNFLIGVPQWEADPTNGPFNTGRVHLVDDTSAVVLTIVNPNPGPNSDDRFGFAVAANSDGTRLLIGAPGDDNEGLNAGRAYLYNNSGILLETFTNPDPTNRGFGGAVEFASNGDILIGSPGFVDETNPPPLQPVLPDPGAAYLFTAASLDLSNATPPGPAQQTFTPPDPGNIGFGGAIAAVQNAAMGTQDDIVIGAPFYPMPGTLLDNVFPTAEGRVYLYDF